MAPHSRENSVFQQPGRGLRVAVIPMVLIWAVVAGCSVNLGHQNVEQDSDLTLDSLVKGGVALGGVYNQVKEFTPQEHQNASRQFNEILKTKRDTIPLTAMEQVVAALGEDSLRALAIPYRENGSIEGGNLSEIKGSLKDRYLLVARVVADGFTTARRMIHPETKKGGGIRVGVSRMREIKVEAHLYDLAQGELVWSSWVKTEGGNKVEFFVKKDKRAAQSGLIRRLTEEEEPFEELEPEARMLVEELYPAPKDPALVQILPKALFSLADNLPQKKGGDSPP